MKNRAYHAGIKRSLYKAIFGIYLKIGLIDSKLINELTDGIITEGELLDIVKDTTMKKTLDENNVKVNINTFHIEEMGINEKNIHYYSIFIRNTIIQHQKYHKYSGAQKM